MKMRAKQKAEITRALEALKRHNCIRSYRIDGEQINSIVVEWVEGGAERALDEAMNSLRPFGVKESDRAWVAWFLPEKLRERFATAIAIEANERALSLCRMVAGLKNERHRF